MLKLQNIGWYLLWLSWCFWYLLRLFSWLFSVLSEAIRCWNDDFFFFIYKASVVSLHNRTVVLLFVPCQVMQPENPTAGIQSRAPDVLCGSIFYTQLWHQCESVQLWVLNFHFQVEHLWISFGTVVKCLTCKDLSMWEIFSWLHTPPACHPTTTRQTSAWFRNTHKAIWVIAWCCNPRVN